MGDNVSGLDLAYSLAADLSGSWTWKVIDPDGVILEFGSAPDEHEASRMALSYIIHPAQEPANGTSDSATD